MKLLKLLLIPLVLTLTQCRTAKTISTDQQVTRDSVTTITERDIKLVVPADSLRDAVNLYDFTHVFNQAQVGDVIRTKQSKPNGIRYSIRKTSGTDFDVEAVAPAQDTTVTVRDTATKVTTSKKLTVVQEREMTWFDKATERVETFAVYLLLVLIALVGLRLAYRHYVTR